MQDYLHVSPSTVCPIEPALSMAGKAVDSLVKRPERGHRDPHVTMHEDCILGGVLGEVSTSGKGTYS